ncbi:protein kinase domain-containing protein [Pseudarthrobacter sp. S9]|uniref:protein kinase domain-containing protein n=1 Tax=Pseudarthrobacter sp. S9 TaxID=3418421 RepID=UPI003CFF80BD
MENSEQAGCAAPGVPGYDVGRLLGRGGNAAVWLVTEQTTGREYAVKCFDAVAGPGAEDREAEAGMRREVRILSALDHDHLVRAHTVLRLQESGAGAGLGLVLDYAAGGSGAELVASRGRLGAGETVTVLTPIAQALAYLHSHGFTHGDVSPGNVLFTAHGKPLLADLGVARMVADSVGTSDAGTEGFRDPAPVDAVRAGLQPERDVYSLAALGWYCLTGRSPGPSAQRPPLSLLVPGVPAALAAALEAGLNEDRRQRPAAAELAAAVYRSAEAAPVDLSVSVHPTVIPQLLTRRSLPRSARDRRAETLQRWRRRIGARRVPAPGRGPESGRAAVTGHTSLTRRAPVTGRAAVPPRVAGGAAARHSAAGSRDPARRDPARRVPGRRRGFRAASVGLAVFLAVMAALAGAWLHGGGRLPELFAATGPAGAAAPAAPAGATEGTAADAKTNSDQGPAAVAVPREVRALLESADPEDAVRGLAALRSLAFSSGDFRLLEQVNVPASDAAAADSRISSRLAGGGHVLAGFSTTLTRVEDSPDSGPTRAVVAISAVSSRYQERDAAGAVVAEAAAGGELRMRLVLVPVDGRWRIQEILPEDPTAG